MKLDVIKLDGGKAGSVDLGDEVFVVQIFQDDFRFITHFVFPASDAARD